MSHKRATIIYNPMSGRPRRRAEYVGQMTELLHQRGIEAKANATAGPDEASRLAEEAVASGTEIIISYGGDRNVERSDSGMAGSQTALAVWPGGTSNVVARDLGCRST
jgi:diacylglycerol kinase family enzyme